MNFSQNTIELEHEFMMTGGAEAVRWPHDDALEEEKRRQLGMLLEAISANADRFFDLHRIGPIEFEELTPPADMDARRYRWRATMWGELKEEI